MSPISLIPYPMPKPSDWLALTPWFSRSPPTASPSPSSPPKFKPKPTSPPTRSSLPLTILLPSPVTTTATSMQTPEMTQVRQHATVVNVAGVSAPHLPMFVSTVKSGNETRGNTRLGPSTKHEDTTDPTIKIPTKVQSRTAKNEPAALPTYGSPGLLGSVQPKPPKQDGVVWLFDLRSAKGAVPWHPNTWKVRLALNEKQIPYSTIWLTYPSITPVLKQLGVPPMQRDRNGKVHYSVPVIVDGRAPPVGANSGPNDENASEKGARWAISGSERILDYLDGAYVSHDGQSATASASTHAHVQSLARYRRSKSQSPPPPASSGLSGSDLPPPSESQSQSQSRSHSHPPSVSRDHRFHSNPSSSLSSSSSSPSPSIRRPRLLQSMFDSMVERVLDPPFWKMILPLAWMNGVLDEESKAYVLEVRRLCPAAASDGKGMGLGSEDNASGSGTDPQTNERMMKRWSPERYVTERDWSALRDGFETIAAFCEMYGIGDGWLVGKKPGSEQMREQKRETMVLTRVEIVLLAYLAALHECVPLEKWVEIRDVWCFGMWGVLWDGSARVRAGDGTGGASFK